MNQNEIEVLLKPDHFPYDKYYVRFDCEKNALDSLRRALEFMLKAESEPDYWKWFVIALHSALYGFAISTICGTDADRVKDCNGKLIDFKEAIKRCRTQKWTRPYGRPLSWTEERGKAIRATTTLRNSFEHFHAISWSIEKAYILIHSLEYLKIIDELASNTTPLSPMRMHGDTNINITRILCEVGCVFLERYSDLLNTEIQKDKEAERFERSSTTNDVCGVRPTAPSGVGIDRTNCDDFF